MSLFDHSGTGPSAEAEFAELQKEAAIETPAEQPEVAAPEPPTETPETTATEAPASEAAEEPAAGEGHQAPGKTVPLAALTEERNARRELERQVAEMRGQMQAWQQQIQPPQPQGQPPAQQQEQPPNRDEDPLGYMAWLEKRVERNEQIQQALTIQTRVQQDYLADAQRFAQQEPHFPAAYNFLFQGRVAELKAQGWQDDAICAQVQREEFGIALGALRAGRSPAQQAFELAKARGFTPPAAQAPAAKPAAPVVDPVLAEAKAKAAASISEGGKAPKSDIALEDIAKLTGAAFDAAVDKLEKRKSSLFRH